MSSRPHAAVVANAKIFPVFANRLASQDINEYINTAKKLKNWLGSEKAYYPDALRNIVSLLEIAHQTFTTRFLQTESSALAAMDIYQALIRAVVPFLRFFTEEDLQLRLQDLIQSTTEVSTTIVYPARAEDDATVQEQEHATSAITAAHDATSSTQLMFPSFAQAESAQSPITTRISTTAIPCSDTHADPPANASIPRTLPKPQPKRQSLASSLSEHLKHRDIEYFKAHHQPAAATPDPKPASPVAPPGAIKISIDTTEPPAEKIRPSRMPGRILSLPASSELTTANEPAAPVNTVDMSSTSPVTEISAPTETQELNQEVISAITDVVMNEPQAENVPRDSETLSLSTLDNVAPKLTTPSPKPNSEALPLGIPDNVAHKLTTPLPKPNSETLPLGTPNNITNELTTPSPKLNTDVQTPKQLPAISSDVGVKSHGNELSSHPVDNTDPQVACSRFGGEMAVMMFRQGLGSPRGTINLTFDLDHTLHLQIARWAKRKSSPTDVEQSVCVSFACYHIPSLLSDPSEDDPPAPLERLTMHSQCSWPTSGDLSLRTKRDGRDFVIPLAPPIFVTPDNCVDISAFIKSGENAFSVVQQSDMSNYMFVLHAHHPTKAQLGHLASCRQKREDWAKVTRAFCTSEPTETLWRRSQSRS